MDYEIRNMYVGGISGIKTVKTSKKFIMAVPEEGKTSLDDK
jgi:hypothetical protein